MKGATTFSTNEPNPIVKLVDRPTMDAAMNKKYVEVMYYTTTVYLHVPKLAPSSFKLSRSSLMEYDKSINKYRSMGKFLAGRTFKLKDSGRPVMFGCNMNGSNSWVQ